MAGDRQAFFERICPALYQDTDPTRLPAEPLAKVLAWQYGPRGLILHGPTGTGKSRAMWLLAKRLLGEGVRLLVFDCGSFEQRMTMKYHGQSAGPWFSYLAALPLICFDDLDKARFTDRVECELFALVERRTANKLPLIVTTNAVGETLEAALPRMGKPLVRRLREFCTCVPFAKNATAPKETEP